MADAQRDLTRVSQQLEREFPSSNASTTYTVVPLRDALVGNTRKPLILLLAAFVLRGVRAAFVMPGSRLNFFRILKRD